MNPWLAPRTNESDEEQARLHASRAPAIDWHAELGIQSRTVASGVAGDGPGSGRGWSDTAVAYSWDEPSLGPHRYAIISAAFADETVRCAAQVGLEFACHDLGLAAVPRLLWLRRVSGPPAGLPSFQRDEVRGVAHQTAHAIGVAADQSPADALETTAHECRHLAQADDLDGTEEGEQEALAYGAETRRRLVKLNGAYEDAPQRLHRTSGFPYPGKTAGVLAGVADYGDLLLAPDLGGRTAIYRNDGTRATPNWSAIR